jgi:epoxyqueuosine reductase QueG
MSSILKRQVRRKCDALGIPLVGFAPADRWDNPPFEPWVPEEFRPGSIVPGTRTVIVIGFPVSLPIIETTPSIWYHELYRTVNTLLDASAYQLALFLSGKGYPSVPIPRDGYGSIEVLCENPVAFFSHRHAAYCAGLGNFGLNNMLLTPAYGPRVRFVSVFTAADIPADPLPGSPLCIKCMRCVKSCPAGALGGDAYPAGLTNKDACSARSEALLRRFISPCGICIKVCPVGEDRKRYGREDPKMYDEKDPKFDQYHRAWKHVRSYGGR